MPSLIKQTNNPSQPSIPINYNLKPPYRSQLQKFQQKCGQCLKALQQYKLKTNFIGCNMSIEDYNKYYRYYTTKPKKRLSFAREKLDALIRAYERNTVFVEALQLKTINNMMKNYRTRQSLMTNQPTNYNYTRFQKDQSQLMQTILNNDCHKLPQLQKLLDKIKSAEEGASQSLKQKLQKNASAKKSNYIRALKAINKSQVRYYRYFQSFQRSIANMVNQIHAYIQKLNQFYTVWENLGSSLIYELKSDREVLIDKTLEQRKSKNFSYCQEDQDQIMQVIDVLPLHSKMRKYYEERLQDFKKKGSRSSASNNTTSNTFSNNNNKNKKGNLKQGNQTITKVSWYETQAQDIKDYNFSDNMVLRQRQDGFFRYTYEELHTETLQYMNQIRNKKIVNDFQGPSQQSYIDRFYVFCQKKDRNRQQHYLNDMKITKYNVPPQMSFSCWFDRLGPKGAFNIQDFPVNLFQRKIQFQIDRQQQMSIIDEKRKRQYNNKQVKLDFMEEQGGYNIGYKYLDSAKQLQDMRHYLANQYDPQFLPEPKKFGELQAQNKQKDKKNKEQQKDFTDSEQQGQKDKKNKNDIQENEKFITNQMYKYESELNDEGELVPIQIKLNNQQEKNQQNHLKDKQTPSTNIKHSQDFLNMIQKYENFKSKTKPQQNVIDKSKILNKSAKQLKQQFPWFQLKKKTKQTIQLFAQKYLPEHQKTILGKFTKQIQRQGYTPQELEPIFYKYLPNCEMETLKQCINIQSQKQNVNKIYLINNQFYVKIKPIYFTVNKKVIKIFIFLISQLKQFEKLKYNLQGILSKNGKCTFQFNVDWLSKNKSYQQKFYAMIGNIIVSQKADRSINNLLNGKQNIQDQKLISIGQKTYEPYQKYCIDLLNLGKEDK